MRARMLSFLLVALGLYTSVKSAADGNIFVCYFTQTSYFPPSAVPAKTCTHLIYAFGLISGGTIKFRDQTDVNAINTLVGLKKQNPELKVLLSLQQGFPTVVTDSQITMEKFSTNAISVLRKVGLDGIDFDWEFPLKRDRDNYSRFLKIFRTFVNKEATGKTPLLVTMALANNVYALRTGYDVTSINQNVDLYTVMAYDLHVFNAKVDNVTGFNSPLYPVTGESKYTSVSGLMSYCLSLGFKPSKMLLGVPSYGRSYKLNDVRRHGIHAPAVSKGDPSPYRHLRGVYAYPDVCVGIQHGATIVSDQTSHGKYIYKGTAWVAYDDVITAAEKTRWAVSQGLRGVGIWSVELDDVDGICTKDKTRLSLMTAIKNALNI
ncbi:acidic mammalian chitinase isoform X3 [Patella vulgata]|uniref:acidic mammalian chitinase isoform X3 n=1 Tax=Patella vulgata TaxID=6465 RepID=UPI0024A9CB07|nr:acidic mammalian chitinase isoform X3 [Patella vulgata]